jgi:hypothetical protein
MKARSAVIVLTLAALAGFAWLSVSRRPPAPAPSPVGTPDTLPSRSAFAGAAVCGECHGEKHARWSSSWHARALTKATPDAVVGRFDGVHYVGRSSEAWMTRRGEEFVTRTRDRERRLGEHRVDWLLGGKRMQDPLTVMPDGRWQVLPVYFHVTGSRWVDYNEVKQGVVGPDHPFFWTNFRRTANRECLDCHSTGLEVRYDRTRHAWSTAFADAGVACESCHGPGARHAETTDARDIVHPRKAGADVGLAICGSCHGPHNPLFPLLDAAHRFRPGGRYDDFYQAFVVTDGRQRSPDFFADGRPSSSSFEYQALLQSACHRKGGATCLTCHTAPHEPHDANDLRPANGSPDESCRGCHASVFAAGRTHTHHRSEAASRCTACHMPKVLTGVLDRFADHALDVPAPQNTRRHGVPNACGECHRDLPPERLEQAIVGWWPGASARQARRIRLADAFGAESEAPDREALAAVVGDGGEAPTLRGAAALWLAMRFPREAAGPIARALSDPSLVLKQRLAAALAIAPSREGVDALLPSLQEPSLAVRAAAALALGTLGTPEGEVAVRRLATDPASAGLVRPHVLLAAMARRRGNLPEVAVELERALDLQPYSAEVLLQIADVQVRQGNWPAARASLEEALRFDPQNRDALEGLAAAASRGR